MRRALELGPRLAYARTWYAIYLAVMRRFGDALHYARAAQALEPLSLTMQLVTARILYWTGRFNEALELLEAMHLAEPGHPAVTGWLARALALSGRPAEGVAVLNEIPERARSTHLLSLEARIRVMSGEGARARALCEAAEAAPSPGGPFLAATWVALGETEQAVAVLEQLLSERSGFLVFCGLDALWAELRQDPGTASVLRKVGVPLE
jgi:tetratricopeptide (TPR) repeat protein